MTFMIAFAALLLLMAGITVWRIAVRVRRGGFIRRAPLPVGLYAKLMQKHPQLSRKDCELVAAGLRQFFLAYRGGGHRYVSMPSQVVDDLWHEFILHTRAYHAFCAQAFGRFLHHSPATELRTARRSNEGLRRCWYQACRQENINPRRPSRLPLLFALDGKLAIAGGFVYVANCEAVRRLQPDAAVAAAGHGGGVHCGGDFSDPSYDGGTDGFGDSDGHGGDSGSDGGGDSGGGCGGGCGGGGD